MCRPPSSNNTETKSNLLVVKSQSGLRGKTYAAHRGDHHKSKSPYAKTWQKSSPKKQNKTLLLSLMKEGWPNPTWPFEGPWFETDKPALLALPGVPPCSPATSLDPLGKPRTEGDPRTGTRTSHGAGHGGREAATYPSQRLWPPARPDCRRSWPWRNHSGRRAWWLEQWTSSSPPWGRLHPPSFPAAPRTAGPAFQNDFKLYLFLMAVFKPLTPFYFHIKAWEFK